MSGGNLGVQMNSSSKAETIRSVLKELGEDATFREIEARLQALNVEVTPQQVSNEKRKLRGRYNANDLPVSVLKQVKALVDELGSTELVRRALDELESLQRSD
jgi:hypothetical protein